MPPPSGASETAPRVCHVVGLSAAELDWVKLTVKLLRHPDPAVGELCRQALDYVDRAGTLRYCCASADS